MTQLTLRGQVVQVEDIKWAPAEPDVGLMSESVDDFTLVDTDGKELKWDLTNEEVNQVMEAIGPKDDDEPEDWI